MTRWFPMSLDPTDNRPTTSAIWIVLLSSATVLFSFGFACATPFVALATVAGTRLRRRDALAAITLAWLGNQTIGFLALHYPATPSTFGWGAAIGLAALAATLAASIARLPVGRIAATAIAFAGAFLAYECVLFAATAVLSSGSSAFAPAVVVRIGAINVGALLGLLALQGAASMMVAFLAFGRRQTA